MKSSIQINTGPTLRQFATLALDDELIVTSKLGSSTVSRVRFFRDDYPTQEQDREDFIKRKVLAESPAAATVLGPMLERCIGDQAKAVDQLLQQ